MDMHLRAYLDQPGKTQQALADKLGVSQGLISQYLNWLDGKRENATRITAERALEIEAATERQVMRHELRADLFTSPPEASQHQVPA